MSFWEKVKRALSPSTRRETTRRERAAEEVKRRMMRRARGMINLSYECAVCDRRIHVTTIPHRAYRQAPRTFQQRAEQSLKAHTRACLA